MTRRLLTTILAIAALLTAVDAAAQTREPEIIRYRFVSDTTTAGLWVNPGVAGFNRRVKLIGHYTWNRPRDEGWTTGQYLIGLQSGVVGFGYRHDEFEAEGEFSQGDAYTVSVGHAGRRMGLGVSRTWRTVGPAEGSWEIGALLEASRLMDVGLVWRDIGTPEVRGTPRDSRLIGAATLTPPERRFTFSAQVDYSTASDDFRAFRIGATAEVLDVVDALATAEWDGDGDFLGLFIGLEVARRTGTAHGVVGFDSNGDARAASAGVVANVGVQR